MRSALVYSFYVELRSNEEVPTSADVGACAAGAKGIYPFGIPLCSAYKSKGTFHRGKVPSHCNFYAC